MPWILKGPVQQRVGTCTAAFIRSATGKPFKPDVDPEWDQPTWPIIQVCRLDLEITNQAESFVDGL